jgi:hypothetical protein
MRKNVDGSNHSQVEVVSQKLSENYKYVSQDVWPLGQNLNLTAKQSF